jgi:NTE family protein
MTNLANAMWDRWGLAETVRPARQGGGLAVVLSGGGMMGAFQAGVLDALSRRDVSPDLVVGTSVGALNAAFWAFHPSCDMGSELRKMWLTEAARSLQPGLLPLLRKLVRHQPFLSTNAGLARVIGRALGAATRIEDSHIPLAVVAADALSGERRVLRRGRLLHALLASTAIPAVLPPVQVEGRLLVDGGMVANCDLIAPLEAEMTDVLAVDLMGDGCGTVPAGLQEVIEHSVSLSLARQTDLQLAAVGGRMRVALLRPVLHRPSLSDATQSARLFELGRLAGQTFVARHLGADGRVHPGLLRFEPVPAARSRAGRAPGRESNEARLHG